VRQAFRPNRRETMWHGTASTLAPRILTEGFVPEPKKKVWSADTGYRASFYGTYFTSNWMLAKSAAVTASDKLGGNPVVFEVKLELRNTLIDEDHMPNADAALAAGNKLACLNTWMCREVLDYGADDVVMFVWNGVRAYWEDLTQRFIQVYGRYPESMVDERFRKAVEGAIVEYLTATLHAGAAAYEKRYSSEDYNEGRNETVWVRKSKANLIERLRGLADRIPGDEFRGSIHNVRLDQPVRFKGANRILSAVEIIYPRNELGQWQSSTPEKPYRLRVLYGAMSPEWLENFDRHIGGDRVIEVGK